MSEAPRLPRWATRLLTWALALAAIAGALLFTLLPDRFRWRPDFSRIDQSQLGLPTPPPEREADVAAHRRALPDYLAGRLALHERRYDDAIAAFSAALDASPRFGPALHHRGLARMWKLDSEGALIDFTSAIRADKRMYAEHGLAGEYGTRYADPYDARAWVRSPDKRDLLLEDIEAAIVRDPEWLQRWIPRDHSRERAVADAPRLAQILDRDPDSPVGHYKLAIVHGTLGEIDRALGHADRALAVAPEWAPAHAVRARLLRRAGDRLGDAIAAFEAAVRYGLAVPAVYLDLGDARWAAGDGPGARAGWAAGLEARGRGYDERHDALLKSRLGLAHAELGNRVQAIVWLRRASRSDPDHVDDLDPRPRDHEPRYRAAARERPRDPLPRFLLAGVRRRAGDLEEAEALYSESFALDPLFLLARLHRGRVRAARGDADGALEDLDAVLAENSGWLLARVDRAALHESVGGNARALKDYRLAAHRPGWGRGSVGLARQLSDAGRHDEALDALTTEDMLRSHDPAVHEARAAVWDALGKPDPARADLTLALAGYEMRANAAAAERVRRALAER